MSKNGVEFLIGWRDFPNIKYDTWDPIINLPGSEHMISLQEFPRLTHVTRQYLTVSVTSVSPECVCFIVTRKILGFSISVVNSSRRNVLKEGWYSVSQN
jgi:hypothetical protein